MDFKTGHIIGRILWPIVLPFIAAWGTRKIVSWVLLAIHVPASWAEDISILASWVVFGLWVYVSFSSKKGSKAWIGDVSHTTKTGLKVKEWVFGLQAVKWVVKLVNPYAGVLVVGGPGSGKSFSIISPIIAQAVRKNFTGIVYDFKYPDLTEKIPAHEKGQPPRYYVNFDDLTRSNRVNPISPDVLFSSSQADAAAHTIMINLTAKGTGDNFFADNAKALLAGIIWYLREEHPTLCTLPHAMALANSPIEDLIRLLSQNVEVRGSISSIRTALEQKAGGQIAAVISTLQNSLRTINKPSLAWVLSGNDFSLNLNDPETPGLLILSNNDELRAVYSPVLSLIVSVASKRMNRPGKLPSMIVLDEAPTLLIPNFSSLPATCRSNKLTTVFAAQNISQIDDMYGDKERKSIVSTLNNQFFGSLSEQESAEYVARMWGSEYVEQRGSSVNYAKPGEAFDSDSDSTSVTKRERLQASDVQGLARGEFLGRLVESDVSLFRVKMTPETLESTPVAPFAEVSQEDVKANFRRIQEEVEQLFSPNSSPVHAVPPIPVAVEQPTKEHRQSRSIENDF